MNAMHCGKTLIPPLVRVYRVQCGIIFYHVLFTCAKYFAFCRSRIFVSWDIVANLRYILYIWTMLFIERLRRATNDRGMGRAYYKLTFGSIWNRWAICLSMREKINMATYIRSASWIYLVLKLIKQHFNERKLCNI
jgi:hypothetical protein